MAYVADALGLPGIGYETALNFTDKFRMRSLTAEAGLPSPPFSLARNEEEAQRAAGEIGCPVVLKPVDSQSSRGVHVVRGAETVAEAFRDALSFSRVRR